MIEQKLIGTTLISTAEFKDELGHKMYPVTVNVKYKNPAGAIITEHITADENNKYSISVVLNSAGDWFFRWESTSGNTTAEEFIVSVSDTKVK